MSCREFWRTFVIGYKTYFPHLKQLYLETSRQGSFSLFYFADTFTRFAVVFDACLNRVTRRGSAVPSLMTVNTQSFNNCSKYTELLRGRRREDPSNRERMKEAWEWEGERGREGRVEGDGGRCRTSINNGPTEEVEIWASLSLRRRLHLHVRKWGCCELAHTYIHPHTDIHTHTHRTHTFGPYIGNNIYPIYGACHACISSFFSPHSSPSITSFCCSPLWNLSH